MLERIFFIFLISVAIGCSESTTVQPAPEVVPGCSPYYISDFNHIVRLDRVKNGYSAEMSGLCANFENKYGELSRCTAFQEFSGEPETVRKETVRLICSRNERTAGAFSSTQGAAESGVLKFMVLDEKLFSEVRESSREFSARKVFAAGKTPLFNSIGQNNKAAYCVYSSYLPLQKDDLVIISDVSDETKAGQRILTYSAEVYGGNNSVSISCMGVGTKESPAATLKKHFGKAIIIN